ncbi:hypothetical protein EHI44_09890 [Rhizobium leguminosarum]|nr:hypothetical protein EHI44_09890 [Rhizobium leguminosarum]
MTPSFKSMTSAVSALKLPAAPRKNGERGRAPQGVDGNGEVAPFAPQAGRRCRQVDEGSPRSQRMINAVP